MAVSKVSRVRGFVLDFNERHNRMPSYAECRAHFKGVKLSDMTIARARKVIGTNFVSSGRTNMSAAARAAIAEHQARFNTTPTVAQVIDAVKRKHGIDIPGQLVWKALNPKRNKRIAREFRQRRAAARNAGKDVPVVAAKSEPPYASAGEMDAAANGAGTQKEDAPQSVPTALNLAMRVPENGVSLSLMNDDHEPLGVLAFNQDGLCYLPPGSVNDAAHGGNIIAWDQLRVISKLHAVLAAAQPSS